MKKKWSFRSISFSKKDKNKPAREEAPKNGDVTKEEPLAEVSKSHLTLYFTGYFIFPNPPPPSFLSLSYPVWNNIGQSKKKY